MAKPLPSTHLLVVAVQLCLVLRHHARGAAYYGHKQPQHPQQHLPQQHQPMQQLPHMSLGNGYGNGNGNGDGLPQQQYGKEMPQHMPYGKEMPYVLPQYGQELPQMLPQMHEQPQMPPNKGKGKGEILIDCLYHRKVHA